MFAYILALAVAIGSIGIYIAAFFFPEIGRKNDIYWSGVGLFYALVLWVCAKQITGGLLLGQIAGVVLLGWFAFQTLQLRRQLTPQLQQTAVPSAAQVSSSVQEQVAKISPLQRLSRLGKKASSKASSSAAAAKDRLQTKSDVREVSTPTEPTPQVAAPAEPTPNVEIVDNRAPVATETTATTSTPEAKIATEVEVVAPDALAESTEIVAAEDRPKSESPSEIAAANTVKTTQTEVATSTETPSSSEEVPELHRPDPPSPELVEAALEDAEEKHQPASPPESEGQ